jgi:H+/gluconate symporter-like permease
MRLYVGDVVLGFRALSPTVRWSLFERVCAILVKTIKTSIARKATAEWLVCACSLAMALLLVFTAFVPEYTLSQAIGQTPGEGPDHR